MSRRVGLGLVVAALVCLVGGLVLPGAAGAERGGKVQVSINGAPFTSEPTGPLLDVNGLVPGLSTTGRFGVRSGLSVPSSLLLRLVEVHDDDNGCTPAEALVDHSCGTGGGELGSSAVMTVDLALTPTGSATQVWTGTAAQLERSLDTKVAVPAGAERWVSVTASLPGSTGNVVQSDTFTFRTRIELATASGVAGVTTSRPGSHQAGGSAVLAVTGTSLLALLAAGVLLLAGLVSLMAGWRRVSPGR